LKPAADFPGAIAGPDFGQAVTARLVQLHDYSGAITDTLGIVIHKLTDVEFTDCVALHGFLLACRYGKIPYQKVNRSSR